MAFLLDDSWDNCGPILQVGNAAFGVYVRCGIWVARNLSDGFVPATLAAAYGSPEYTQKLVDAGLWEIVDGGYRVVDYLTLNPTGDKVRAKRKAAAERQAKWREGQNGKREGTRESRVSSRRDTRRESRPSSPSLKGEGAREATCAGFADDGHGWCTVCGRIKANKIHFRVKRGAA